MSKRSQTLPLFAGLPHGYRIDQGLGAVYEDAPAAADDLTLIRGVRTREAVALNHLGVHFLAQVALWESSEVCEFAGELGIASDRILDEQWVEQAKALCGPSTPDTAHPMPASFIRTVSLLACALALGCLVVYWTGLRPREPMTGILSAEITSVRVPADALLVASHVHPGSEVFSGEKLLTLEKTEHLNLIPDQEHAVRRLQQQLQQAEAQATLDLAWRTRDIERELADVRARAELIQEVNSRPAELLRTASTDVETISPSRVAQGTAVPASRSRGIEEGSGMKVNGLLFVNGPSGRGAFESARPLVITSPEPAVPIAPVAPRRVVKASPASASKLLELETRTVELRLQQLEKLKQDLPVQVRQAAGVESLRQQHDEAIRQLERMNARSREITVLCPAYGTVGETRYHQGDLLPAGEIVLKILHTDRRFVLVHLPTRRINELQPGCRVDLIFPGGDRYDGTVTNLPMLAEPALSNGASMATVRVEQAGKLWPALPIGSQVDVVLPH